MKQEAKELQYYLNSQSFSDGIRITIAILLPSVIGYYLDLLDIGLTLSLGSLCVSIADAPGPVIHRKNGMLICLGFTVLVSFITSLARLHIATMGLEVVLFSFFFSMFNVYGTRAAAVGNAALLVMVLSMEKLIPPSQALWHSIYIGIGGVWYVAISLLLYQLQPYRMAQRTLGESIRDLSRYLKIKARFYDCATDLEADYQKLISQQIVVSEKQDALREILFKTRQTLQESTPASRKLVLAFVDTVDLFEDITAIYYDYAAIRKRYANAGILNDIAALLRTMATELDNIGIAIQNNTVYKSDANFDNSLAVLKQKIEAIEKGDTGDSHLVLKKIRVNMRRIAQRFKDVMRYFDTAAPAKSNSEKEYQQFVGHQSLDPKIIWENLSFSSSVFKHAFRVALACMVGFAIAKLMAYGHHSYWIIMTIIFMIKPAFSLTKQRNLERIGGTITGGIMGVLILWLLPYTKVQFGLMVFFMILTYSFQRTRYFLFVVFLTPFILILFHFLGVGFLTVVQERVLDTLLGCVIAFLAGYLLFPDWEVEQLNNYMKEMLEANGQYMQQLLQGLTGSTIGTVEYKLVRKKVYVSSANLTAAFQRMLSEPKSKQHHKQEIHHFVVLNHIIYSNIATLTTSLFSQPQACSPEVVRPAKKALKQLCESILQFDKDCHLPVAPLTPKSEHLNPDALTAEETAVKEQLDYIYKISKDIYKTTLQIVDAAATPPPTHNPLVPVQ